MNFYRNSLNTCQIVLVDDDKDDQFIFCEAFEDIDKNINICTFNNGQEFLDFIAGSEESYPAIVFMDLNMPILNGIQCLNKLREQTRFKDLSIIIYSTSNSERDIKETFEIGANRYMNKPNSFSKLKSLLSQAISLDFIKEGFSKTYLDGYLLA